jgi:regulator of sigma E protease
MLGFIAVVLVLGGLIFVHELGHFLVARGLGVGVRTFCLGFGPRLWGVKRGKTDYRVAALPLGGYVQLVGENPGEDLPEDFTPQESFSTRPAWQRMLVVAAGPISNLLLAWLVLWVLLALNGEAVVIPRIGQVVPDTPAAAAGLLAGDLVLAVDGTPVAAWQDMQKAIGLSEGKPIRFRVERGDQRVQVEVVPKMVEGKVGFLTFTTPVVGIASSQDSVRFVEYTWLQALPASLSATWDMASEIKTVLTRLFLGQSSLKQLGGPISIFAVVSESAKHGLTSVFYWVAMLSVNLGLLNLLPIPVLDGGHLLFCAVETVLRRPVPERWQMVTTRMGLAFLICLMLFVTVMDVGRIDFARIFGN